MTQTKEDLVSLVRDGRTFRERRAKWEEFWLRFTLRLVLLAPLDGLSLMLLVGVVHHEWWPQVPTIGYWWAVLVGVFWRGFNTPMKWDKK